MYHSDGSYHQRKYLHKAHHYCKKACEYIEKAMRCGPCDNDRPGYDRYGGGCRWPTRYGEYRHNPHHMDSSSCYTYADNENLLDT
ncbi:hypothetical protein [Thermoactinomyces mirandus]|uniref:Uncharacterized protein n=1 Tax=Thermoactinomyces mirandus TaxID=2756294 RepID=A0A7W2ARA6_9BACL|nr:hypothetical protein [Thermoactinomyces mirandus]MBA4602137.1 hypothetical protein [Thermoactinomyces mirandus]